MITREAGVEVRKARGEGAESKRKTDGRGLQHERREQKAPMINERWRAALKKVYAHITVDKY